MPQKNRRQGTFKSTSWKKNAEIKTTTGNLQRNSTRNIKVEVGRGLLWVLLGALFSGNGKKTV